MRQSLFIKSATHRDQFPASDLPKIAFMGRSNVGKSSLLNCLVGKKGLARTSSAPGRTRLVNFFQVGKRFIFVDLPGYGYARVATRARSAWISMVEELFSDLHLKLVLALVDARHTPSELDQVTVEWLYESGIAFSVVATKVDKLKKTQRQRALDDIQNTLKIDAVLPFSSKTGEGRQTLWKILEEAIA